MTKLPRSSRLLIALALSAIGGAQQAPLTLARAVQEAADKYPAVRVSLEQVSAAAAGINLARASYLPRADLVAQVNRATHRPVWCERGSTSPWRPPTRS